METNQLGIVPVNIEETMQEAYLEYAMSVIVGRALPDVRDGLKPVHRRILFAMHEASNTHDKPYKKSARIVGDTIGKFHPHGDQAVYESLVRMAQDFSMRYQIVDGQGNFGSIDGDSAAAMRYTEVRLKKIADGILADIEKETVDFVPNYDGHQFEPSVMPSRVPNLLVNGSSGIAVGMSTNIPPHNMGEIIDGSLKLLENPDTSIQDLTQIIKGPDFPTGGIIVGMSGIYSAYGKGFGTIKIKGKADIETFGKDDRERIIISEIPYQVNKAKLIERIAQLVRDKQIEGISGLRDESNRDGIRVVVETKADASGQVVLNQLLQFTQLQVSFAIQMIALDGRRPRVLNLKEILNCFLKHRRDVVTRRSVYDLKQCEDKAHILHGLVKALESIDAIIALIKGSPSGPAAKEGLISKFQFSDKQAQAILDLRLQRLTALERDKIDTELKELQARIAELKEILSSEEKLKQVISQELLEVREAFADPRKTEIMPTEGEEFVLEDLIEDEEVVLTFSNEGYIKRMPAKVFQSQNRGGKGVIGTTLRDEDFTRAMFSARTHDHLLCLTSLGRIYRIHVYEVPEASRTAKGKNIATLIQLNAGEKVQNIIPTRSYTENEYLVLLTKYGNIKKMDMIAFERMRVSGKTAITLLGEDDALIGSSIVKKDQDLLICTQNGKLIRFKESDVRSTGASSQGVRGITLTEGDAVVGLEVCDDDASLLTVTENGFGKQTPVNEYRLQSRGGKGVLTGKVTPKTGKIVSVLQVRGSEDLMVISSYGKMIRTNVASISTAGRNTQGVILMRVAEDEKVAAVTILAKDGESDAEPIA